MRRNGAFTKQQRLKEISRMLRGANRVPIKKVVALIEFKFGLTKKRILEYFEILEAMDHIAIDHDMKTITSTLAHKEKHENELSDDEKRVLEAGG